MQKQRTWCMNMAADDLCTDNKIDREIKLLYLEQLQQTQ